MQDSVGQLGIQDFFNVLIIGFIFIIGLIWIYPDIWYWYISIDNNYNKEKYVCTLVVVYVLGICLQEVGNIVDSRILKIKKRAISSCLWGEELYTQNVLNKSWFFRLYCKLDYKRKILFRDKTIVGNTIKQEVYRLHGQDILNRKEIKYNGEFSAEQNEYIYSFCYYYIEHLDKHKKYEKMRALFDMTRALCASAIIIIILSFLNLMYDICTSYNLLIIQLDIWKTVVFLCAIIIFYCRADKLMKYKVRILMEVYDICVEIGSSSN